MTVESSSSKPGYDESVRILQQIWDTMSLDVNDGKYPKDESEIKKVNQLLEELAAIDCLDLDIIEQRRQCAATLKEATQKVFAGSRKIMAICILVVLVLIMIKGVKSPGSGTINDTVAKQKYDSRLNYTQNKLSGTTSDLNRYIEQQKNFESANKGATDPRLAMRIKNSKEYIERLEKDLSEYKSQTVDDFKDEYNDRIRSKNWSHIMFTLYLLSLPVLYYFSARIPIYMRCRRHQWLEHLEVGQNVLGRIFMGIITVFMSITPTTVIREENSLSLFSSRKVVETDYAFSLAIKLTVLAIAAAIIFAFAVYVLPLIVIFNFGINYLPQFMEKNKTSKMQAKAPAKTPKR
ncbi:hypothetical protein [uncultured Desulfobacter sp.]|uniref:hypothetical protein n=1 Tax=uncultured Desulfobacter sp. TaxID=240139 RepID=UPI002AABB09C|nr:hypothetical protein [uncultured Desulfobacter sp.]